MSDLPPLLRDQRAVDAEHLKVLSICHYVAAGLSLLGILVIGLQFAFMSMMFNRSDIWQNAQGSSPWQNGNAPPPAFLGLFAAMFGLMALLIVVFGVLNWMSARSIARRTNRTLSLVTAGMNLIQFPLGTILGVFTFIVLMRDSVRELYRAIEYGTKPFEPVR